MSESWWCRYSPDELSRLSEWKLDSLENSNFNSQVTTSETNEKTKRGQKRAAPEPELTESHMTLGQVQTLFGPAFVLRLICVGSTDPNQRHAPRQIVEESFRQCSQLCIYGKHSLLQRIRSPYTDHSWCAQATKPPLGRPRKLCTEAPELACYMDAQTCLTFKGIEASKQMREKPPAWVQAGSVTYFDALRFADGQKSSRSKS